MFCSREQKFKHPKWTEWCKKSEEEQLKIAEENGWMWYTDWYDLGEIVRSAYEQADTSDNVTKKYGGYDRWDEEHQIETSNVFLGMDGSFHTSNKPTNQWTVYNPCTNDKCPYNQGEYANSDECGYFGCNERQYDCFNDLFASIQAVIDICGEDELNNLQKDLNIHSDIIGWFIYGKKYFSQQMKPTRNYNLFISDLIDEYNNQYDNIDKKWAEQYYDENFLNVSDKDYIYAYKKIFKKGDDKMYFLEELSKIKQEDDISVYWIENQMYVNDESDGQATETCSLFEAYKFSVLINADFDYTATDKEVKELSEELLDLIDEDFYRVNVWEYIDSISDDFAKLTGIQLGIDDKRGVVCGMTDDGAYDILCDFGSATYIAKLLWRYIKGDNNIKMMNGDLLFKGCDNPIANELAEKHLMSDDYDLKEFAKALHKVTQTNWIVPTSFNDYLDKTYNLTCKCYWLGTSLLSAQKDFNETFIVGRINWQGDWEKPIYCHIDSYENIWFEANGVKSATLYDVMLPHLMIGKDIKEFALKLTKDDFIKVCKKYDLDGENINDSIFGYIHCSMYGTKGCLQKQI